MARNTTAIRTHALSTLDAVLSALRTDAWSSRPLESIPVERLIRRLEGVRKWLMAEIAADGPILHRPPSRFPRRRHAALGPDF